MGPAVKLEVESAGGVVWREDGRGLGIPPGNSSQPTTESDSAGLRARMYFPGAGIILGGQAIFAARLPPFSI
ncbi:MAG: hypothetical protein ABIG63_02460 [Chloroflexota bacterium]